MKLRRNKPSQNEPRRAGPRAMPPGAFSYYARGAGTSNQNIGRYQTDESKPSRFKLGHLPSYIALVALLGALLYSLWLQPNPRVVLLAEAGTIQRDPKTYQTGVNQVWHHSIFNQLKFTVDGQAIQRDIQSRFNELASVNVQLPLLGRRPTVVLTPAHPVMQLISINGIFYVDANGKVLARVSDVHQNQVKDLVTVRDETGITADVAKPVLAPSQAVFLRQLAAQIQASGLTIQSIRLPAGVANEADVFINNQSFFVKFSMDSDARQATGTFLAAKARLEADHALPQQYMDVRVEEKAFFK